MLSQGQGKVETSFLSTGNQAEDIMLMRNQRFNVDGSNEPAEENIPAPTDVPADIENGLYPRQTWCWGGIDQCRINTPTDYQPG